MVKTRKAAGSLNIAKAIFEEEKNGLFPVEFSLPEIYFSDNGTRAELNNKYMQALVEEKLELLREDDIYSVKTNLRGLDMILEGEDIIPEGNNVTIRFDSSGMVKGIVIDESVHEYLKPSVRKRLDACMKRNSEFFTHIGGER